MLLNLKRSMLVTSVKLTIRALGRWSIVLNLIVISRGVRVKEETKILVRGETNLGSLVCFSHTGCCAWSQAELLLVPQERR